MINDLMDYPLWVINDETNNKLLMGLRACLSTVQLVIGDFSHFRPNGDSQGFLSNHSLWGKG